MVKTLGVESAPMQVSSMQVTSNERDIEDTLFIKEVKLQATVS